MSLADFQSPIYDQSTECRTRAWVPDTGFLTTIQNITDVARLNAYLWGLSGLADVWSTVDLPGEDVLCVVISKIDGRHSANRNALRLSLVGNEHVRNYNTY